MPAVLDATQPHTPSRGTLRAFSMDCVLFIFKKNSAWAKPTPLLKKLKG